MKICLIGYPGSKHILPASSFLIDKYIPTDFEVNFLNFGDYDEDKLFCGNYVKLDETQEGGSSAWSRYLKDYFNSIEDEFVIFSLDDFFLCRDMDMEVYDTLFKMISSDSNIACAKLGIGPHPRVHEMEYIKNSDIHAFSLIENASYSASTQYSIWRRTVLVDLLNNGTDAWSFELRGTDYLNGTGQKVVGSSRVCLPYSESSAVSNRHPNKISVLGINPTVVDEMLLKNLFPEEDLILGQPFGSVPAYSEYKSNVLDGLNTISENDYKEYCTLVCDLVEDNTYLNGVVS